MIVRVLVGMCLVAGCLTADVVQCADGRVCPSGSLCDDERRRCVSPEQQLACTGLDEGAACELSGAPGTCRAGACDPLICGDRLRTGTESCDGEDLDGATCASIGFYRETTGLACAADCRFDTAGCDGRCGDEIVEGAEQCDGAGPAGSCVELGFDAGPLRCTTTCSVGFGSCARFGWRTFAAPVVAFAIAASGPTNLWAVGDLGVALRSTGGAWTPVPTGVQNPLISVWAIAPDNVWAIGLGVQAADPSIMLHLDATGFRVQPGVTPAAYTDVWAANANAVYVATGDKGVLSYNGQVWSSIGNLTGIPLDAIHGTSASDLWVVGKDGSIRHWNGAAFSVVPLAGFADDVIAIAPDDVWFLGASDVNRTQGLLAHWNGAALTPYAFTRPFVSLAASAYDDAWAIAQGGEAFHFDGRAWVETGKITPTGDLSAPLVVSTAAGEVSGVSFSQVGYEFRHHAIGRLDPGSAAPGDKALGAYSSDRAGGMFIADNIGNVGSYDGTKWVSLPDPGFTVRALWSDSRTNAFAVGGAGQVLRWNGAAWLDMNPPTTLALDAVWGTSATDVWVFGAEGAFHYTGAWSAALVPGPIRTASGTGSNNLFAVRDAAPSELWRWNGATFQMVATQALPLREIAAVAADSVFAVSTTRVLRWSPAGWQIQDVTPIDPTQIVATAFDDVTAASDTAILHFDGERWSPIRPPNPDITNPIKNLAATPSRIDVVYNRQAVRGVVRVRPWVCRSAETSCSDGTDEDCDGAIDRYDTECR